MGGYAGSLLRVDLSSGRVARQPIDPAAQRAYLGSRGLGAWLFRREVAAGVDPFGPDNKLLVVTAPLNGTRLLSSPKFTAVAHSPLTRFYGESSTSGGRFALHLKQNGFDALVIEGKAKGPSYLLISGGQASIRPAGRLWGLPVTEAERELKSSSNSNRRSVALIGPAGENLVRFAAIRVERALSGPVRPRSRDGLQEPQGHSGGRGERSGHGG